MRANMLLKCGRDLKIDQTDWALEVLRNDSHKGSVRPIQNGSVEPKGALHMLTYLGNIRESATAPYALVGDNGPVNERGKALGTMVT